MFRAGLKFLGLAPTFSYGMSWHGMGGWHNLAVFKAGQQIA